RRRGLVRRAAAVAAPALVAGAAYVVAVHRPRGAGVVGAMSHREARPGSDRVHVVGRTDAGTPGPGGDALPPVVLVHGLGMSGRSLQALVRRVGATTWALAPDLPGYGRSPRPRRGALGVGELADAVVAWMRVRGVGPAVLVGHSLGAQVAGEVALRAPDLVLRLVVVAPTGDPESPGVLGLAARLARDGLRERPSLVGVAALDYLRAGPGQMLVLMGRALRRARSELDERLPVPLLVTRGELDPVVRQEWCERLAGAVDRGRCEAVPGHAHGVAFDAPPALVRLVLAEVRAAAGR
ncbi:alpha/beta fold hydrolase, partial [Pseudokineococcus basanitobsidens]